MPENRRNRGSRRGGRCAGHGDCRNLRGENARFYRIGAPLRPLMGRAPFVPVQPRKSDCAQTLESGGSDAADVSPASRDRHAFGRGERQRQRQRRISGLASDESDFSISMRLQRAVFATVPPFCPVRHHVDARVSLGLGRWGTKGGKACISKWFRFGGASRLRH